MGSVWNWPMLVEEQNKMKAITGGLAGWTGTEIRKSNLLDVELVRACRFGDLQKCVNCQKVLALLAWMSDEADKKCIVPPPLHCLGFFTI